MNNEVKPLLEKEDYVNEIIGDDINTIAIFRPEDVLLAIKTFQDSLSSLPTKDSISSKEGYEYMEMDRLLLLKRFVEVFGRTK